MFLGTLKYVFYEPQHKSWLLALHPELITETCCHSPSVILCHNMVAMTHSYHLSRAFSALQRHSSHRCSTFLRWYNIFSSVVSSSANGGGPVGRETGQFCHSGFANHSYDTCSLRPRHIRERSFTSIPTPALMCCVCVKNLSRKHLLQRLTGWDYFWCSIEKLKGPFLFHGHLSWVCCIKWTHR